MSITLEQIEFYVGDNNITVPVLDDRAAHIIVALLSWLLPTAQSQGMSARNNAAYYKTCLFLHAPTRT